VISTRGSRAHCRNRKLSQPTTIPNKISPITMSVNVPAAFGSENVPVTAAATAKR
jgi:hypothetical protein